MGEPHEQFAVLSAVAPCDECKLREKCARECLACARFVSFYSGAPEGYWRAAPCAPDRSTRLSIFDRHLVPRAAATGCPIDSIQSRTSTRSKGRLTPVGQKRTPITRLSPPRADAHVRYNGWGVF